MLRILGAGVVIVAAVLCFGAIIVAAIWPSRLTENR